MKAFFSSALLVSALVGSLTARAAGPFGLGIFLGEPIGVTGKYNLDPASSIDFLAAWSFGRGNAFYIHGDYLYHFRGLLKVEPGTAFDLHVGGGGALSLSGGSADFALRAPVGLGHTFREVPIEVFVEIAIHFVLAPSTAAAATGGIGARYYF